MSILPLLYAESFGYPHLDPWELKQHCPRRRQASPWNQFGLNISPSEIHLLSSIPSVLLNDKGILSPRNKAESLQTSAVGKDGFQVHMDVQQFKPSEICVKTIDNFVVVEAKHEERQDEHGFISRHFVRKYKLPTGYDANLVTSTLSSDGVLTIKAPTPSKLEDNNVRIVQIQQTGPAHLNIKENKNDEKEAEEQKENGEK
ncbi:heat shock protein 23-like [Condylostylus longicornis]|uniref:heat shock protein 23-like n=1 Tax=Condylostylus longicornis TaxID=2530218 RepID=UPI00244DDB2B|nr:heat shock protein 23-like [Condylostylus longicornis]